ncbi:hypothetical protein RUM44_009467 [Polyplax serrata]|uniref:Uncharacterized protein n=1 Tax=Polyplax serrata TaxID=468196 RepID=A0ABR1ASS6_POLSC
MMSIYGPTPEAQNMAHLGFYISFLKSKIRKGRAAERDVISVKQDGAIIGMIEEATGEGFNHSVQNLNSISIGCS